MTLQVRSGLLDYWALSCQVRGRLLGVIIKTSLTSFCRYMTHLFHIIHHDVSLRHSNTDSKHMLVEVRSRSSEVRSQIADFGHFTSQYMCLCVFVTSAKNDLRSSWCTELKKKNTENETLWNTCLCCTKSATHHMKMFLHYEFWSYRLKICTNAPRTRI